MATLEAEADRFARDTLIDPKEYAIFVEKRVFTRASIEEFAEQVKIQSGIVVGRLQKDGYIKYNHFNDLKRKYKIVINHKKIR
ncbi:hypothetical protein AB9M75_11915 [Lactobacillus sp. AN1001]